MSHEGCDALSILSVYLFVHLYADMGMCISWKHFLVKALKYNFLSNLPQEGPMIMQYTCISLKSYTRQLSIDKKLVTSIIINNKLIKLQCYECKLTLDCQVKTKIYVYTVNRNYTFNLIFERIMQCLKHLSFLFSRPRVTKL